MVRTLDDEFGFAYQVEVPDRPEVPVLPECVCRCGTREYPQFDPLCANPEHAEIAVAPVAAGLRHSAATGAVKARLGGGER